MMFPSLLFSTNLVLCAITVCESSDTPHFLFIIWNKMTFENEDLSTEYPFGEGLEYVVGCRRHNDWDLHWEVEPFGLKSTSYSCLVGYNEMTMTFKLHRDDQITIGCYSKNKESHREENKTTTFVWNKIVKPVSSPPPPTSISDARDDADDKHKCYQKNNTTKCAFFIYNMFQVVDLQTYTRKNHDNKNLVQDDIKNKTSDDDKEPNKNVNGVEKPTNVKSTKDSTESATSLKKEVEEKRTNVTSTKDSIESVTEPQNEVEDVWVLAVAGVAAVAVLSVVCFICYKVRRKRKQQEELYSYTYADQIRSDASGPPPPAVEMSHYSRIIGILRRKKPRVEDLVYAEIQYDGAVPLQRRPPPPPPLPPTPPPLPPSPPPLPPRVVTSPSSSSPSLIAENVDQW